MAPHLQPPHVCLSPQSLRTHGRQPFPHCSWASRPWAAGGGFPPRAEGRASAQSPGPRHAPAFFPCARLAAAPGKNAARVSSGNFIRTQAETRQRKPCRAPRRSGSPTRCPSPHAVRSSARSSLRSAARAAAGRKWASRPSVASASNSQSARALAYSGANLQAAPSLGAAAGRRTGPRPPGQDTPARCPGPAHEARARPPARGSASQAGPHLSCAERA